MMTQDQRLQFIDRLAATPEILCRLPHDAQNELRVLSLANQQRLQQPNTPTPSPALAPQAEASEMGETEQAQDGTASRYPLRSRRRTSTIGEEDGRSETVCQETPEKGQSENDSSTESGSSPCRIRIVGTFGPQSK